MVERAVCVADIGCDHGFVPIYMVENGICERAIAMDVRSGPLGKATDNVSRAGLSDRIELRLSDGADKLNVGEADAITICGMGGALIRSIMEAKPEVFRGADRLVLGPQSEIYDFRRFLLESGYDINDEQVVFEEEKYYFLIKSQYIGMPQCYNEAELNYGRHPLMRRDETLKGYILKERQLALRVLDGLPDKSIPAGVKNLNRIRFIDNVLGDYYG
ncbi:MAG: class I SAM-dependent methyltransferase [Lachnospiraceae bacterium]|nr:class I SAM-dependent methyltransferase [Lachnospiraceae bacterium]